MFCKKGVLKNFANFTGKHLCWSLFTKVAGLQTCNFIKKRPQNRCFPEKFVKYLQIPILNNICERLLFYFSDPLGATAKRNLRFDIFRQMSNAAKIHYTNCNLRLYLKRVSSTGVFL